MDHINILRAVVSSNDTSIAQNNYVVQTCLYMEQDLDDLTFQELQEFMNGLEDVVLKYSLKLRASIDDIKDAADRGRARDIATFWLNQLQRIIHVKGEADQLFNRLYIGQFIFQMMAAPH